MLRYRLGREKESPYKIAEHLRCKMASAVRLVRSRAKEWGINPSRIGMMGFSAGGEVVALVCRNADKGREGAEDPIDRESCRPDFQALIYSGPLGITRQAVTNEIPPSFILVGDDDNAARWLVEHYQALKRVGVSAELHVYAKTPHGFGYRPNKTGRPVDSWLQRFYEFLRAEGMLKKE